MYKEDKNARRQMPRSGREGNSGGGRTDWAWLNKQKTGKEGRKRSLNAATAWCSKRRRCPLHTQFPLKLVFLCEVYREKKKKKE